MKNKETRLLVKIVMCGLGGIVWIVDCANVMSRGRQGLGLSLLPPLSSRCAGIWAVERRKTRNNAFAGKERVLL